MTRHLRASTAGFALVITMLLLGLLVLAILALSFLVRVDGQVSTTGVYQAQARQNALLALDVAIADLQAKAGPDQRVTATAGMLAGTDPTKQCWTGVWDNNGSLQGWLVSGENASVSGAVAPGADQPLVTLVATNSAGSTVKPVQVQVEPIRISGLPGVESGQSLVTGHYGYWVGDEGVKATANFSETLDQLDYSGPGAYPPATDGPTSPAGMRMRQMLLPRPRIEEISTKLDPTTATTRANLLRIQSYDQIGLAGSGTVSLASDFYDLTAKSLGVLSDPVNGGLKRDISVPGAATTAAGTAIGAWMSVQPVTTTRTTASHAIAAPSSGLTVAPLLTEFSVRFCFYRSGSATAANGSLSVMCQMQAEFWNPYDSTLVGDGANGLRITVSGLPQNLTVTTGSGLSFPHVDLQSAVDQMSFQLPSSTTWAPGAVSVFYGGSAWSNTSTTAAGLSSDFLLNVPSTTVAANRSLRVDSTEGATLTVHLLYKGEEIATYHPETSFGSFTGATNSAWAGTTTWLFGYGFAAKDSFSYWADGSAASSMDPKQKEFTGSFVETGSSIWQSDPVANKSLSILRSTSGGATFYASTSAPVYMLFELPQQEVMSLGALQHVPGKLPNEIGNPWGGAANAVFDKTFLSDLPRNGGGWSPSTLPAAPNAFLELYRGASDPNPAALLDASTAAAHLLVRGSFNVNSISSKAWSVVLGGAKIPADYTIPNDALTNAFFRHSHSAQDNATSASKPTGATTARKQGVRDITDVQVGALAGAVALLNHNRTRPFLSLQDFVNTGVIATALDPALAVAGETSSATTNRQSINGGSTLVKGMPSYLSQADILTSIAPFIAARSDTFRIRVYGDAVNPADASRTEAVAYCEAIVQRVPDYVDSRQTAEVATPNPLNAHLGRRFVITYLRWLAPGDI